MQFKSFTSRPWHLPLLLGSLLSISAPLAAQTPTVRYAFAGNALDQSGNGRDGTLVAGATYTGASRVTIGNNAADYLRIPSSAMDGLGDFTVVVVAQFNTIHSTGAGALNTILSAANTVDPQDNVLLFALSRSISAYRFQINSNDYRFGFTPAEAPVGGTAYHLAFVRQGGVGRFYVNGVQRPGALFGNPITMDVPVTATPLTISAGGLLVGQEQDFSALPAPPVVASNFQATQSLAGNLGELTVYNGALTSAQIASLARTTWTGDVSAAWTNINNWNRFLVPTATTDVVVPAAPAAQPTISAPGATARALTLDAGSALTLTATGTLSIQGNLVNNSSGAALNGLTSFAGAAPQQISGDGATVFQNLTVGAAGLTDASSSGVTVNQVLTLTGNYQSGTVPLRLPSSAAGTAMVVNSGGAITNAARIERYLDPGANAGKGYRHMASPVQNTPLNDLNVAPLFAVKVNPAYNVNPNQPASKFPNVFRYNEARVTSDNFGLGWESPLTAATPMAVGVGYSAFMPALTVDFVGVPNTGTQPAVPCTNTGGFANSGWNLLGNPYPSPLDWDLVRSNNLVPAGMTDGVSVFQSGGLNTGTYQVYNNGVGNLPNGEIASGQAFFVRVPAPGTVNFTFSDAMRPTAYANPTHFRAAATRPLLTLALRSVGPDVTDEAMVYFEEGATANFDARFDGAKPGPSQFDAPTLNWLTPAGETVALNALPPADLAQALTTGLRLPLLVRVNVAGTHELSAASLRGLPAGQPVWLFDEAANTVVDLAGGQPYRFQLDPAFRGTRFSVQLGGAQPKTAAPGSHHGAPPTLAVYPNPATTATGLTVAVRDLPPTLTCVQATLVDRLGSVVSTRTLPVLAGSVAATWPTHELRAGLYSLRISGAGMATVATRLLVE